ncbi:hypothetical protein RJT34_32170 [Clitoria ternatea]|uniref:Uncharacterized protein n=1 Tax=Clitoria ternatea TaxID=43366 RepID=A0AAN9EWF0_CLITE
MGTQVLRPQDCLAERFSAPPEAFYRRRCAGNYCNNYYYYHNNNNNHHAVTSKSLRKPVTRPDHKKRVPVGSFQPLAAELKRSSSDDSRITRSSAVAAEKVMILRRGQSLDSAVKSDVYAGSAFAVSPSPSALPLPSFSTKKGVPAAFDDSATRDLRRLLRLE